jgi:CTP synthase
VEIAEISDHPFMLGTQFHPEFLSRPNRPHPLFVAFLRAVKERAGLNKTSGEEVKNTIESFA